MSKQSPLAARLAKAVEGLVLPSERDQPFTVVKFPGSDLPSDARAFRKLAGIDAKTPVGDFSPADMLNKLGKEQSHDGSDVKRMRARFRMLADLFAAEFATLRGFKVGTVNVETYLLGRTTDGAVLGLKAGGVET